MPKSQQPWPWVRSQHPLTQWNLRGVRCSNVYRKVRNTGSQKIPLFKKLVRHGILPPYVVDPLVSGKGPRHLEIFQPFLVQFHFFWKTGKKNALKKKFSSSSFISLTVSLYSKGTGEIIVGDIPVKTIGFLPS